MIYTLPETNDQIKGIQLNTISTEKEHLQFADDVILALRNIKLLEKATETVENFCNHSG